MNRVSCYDSNFRNQEYEWWNIIDIISISGIKDMTKQQIFSIKIIHRLISMPNNLSEKWIEV